MCHTNLNQQDPNHARQQLTDLLINWPTVTVEGITASLNFVDPRLSQPTRWQRGGASALVNLALHIIAHDPGKLSNWSDEEAPERGRILLGDSKMQYPAVTFSHTGPTTFDFEVRTSIQRTGPNAPQSWLIGSYTIAFPPITAAGEPHCTRRSYAIE